MLEFSFASVLIAILVCNLLLIFLTLILQNQYMMLRSGFTLIQIFVVVTILRFLFPFELPFTTNIHLPEKISKFLTDLVYAKFSFMGRTFYTWNFIEIVWCLGSLICALWYIRNKYQLYRFIKKHGQIMDTDERYAPLLAKVCQENDVYKTIHIVQLPALQSPMVSRFFTYYICIPENLYLDESELNYIFHHEISHICHHDLLVKFLIQFICMLYWWNPFCYLLRKQTNLLCELHVDQSVVHSYEDGVAYMNCLIKVMEQTNNETFLHNSIPFSSTQTIMQKRFSFLFKSGITKPNSFLKLSLIPIFILYLLSLVFIFEPVSIDAETEQNSETISSEKTYMIHRNDNTYDVYYNGIFIENTDSLEYYPEDCKIYQNESEAEEDTRLPISNND